MKTKVFIKIYLICLVITLLSACGEEPYTYKDPQAPIVWDSNSLQRVSNANVYSGYARLIQ